jgi:hypothetical protein
MPSDLQAKKRGVYRVCRAFTSLTATCTAHINTSKPCLLLKSTFPCFLRFPNFFLFFGPLCVTQTERSKRHGLSLKIKIKAQVAHVNEGVKDTRCLSLAPSAACSFGMSLTGCIHHITSVMALAISCRLACSRSAPQDVAELCPNTSVSTGLICTRSGSGLW